MSAMVKNLIQHACWCSFNHETENLIVLSTLLCQLFFVSCTNTPWHRDQADIALSKGVALIQAGQYIGALKELLEADKNAPDDPEINYYLGVAYLGRGLKDLAMERFQKAVSLKADYSEAHNYIGTMYMDTGQWQKAIDAFDKALKNYLYATPGFALYNSGWAHYNLQNYDMALSRYQQALREGRMDAWQPQIEKNNRPGLYSKIRLCSGQRASGKSRFPGYFSF